MKLTQDEYSQIINLLGDVIISQKILSEVARTPINTASNKNEMGNLLKKYYNLIESFYKKYKDMDVPSDAYKVYEQAILLTLHEVIFRSLECTNGMNTLSVLFSCQLNIDGIQQQLRKDFLDDESTEDFLQYNGKYPVTSSKEISIATSYQRSETLYEALSQHPLAFFTQSEVGLSTLALGAGLTGYAIHKFNLK